LEKLKLYFGKKKLKILDFGSGIGTRSFIYAKRNDVTLVEINKKLLDFSEWRFKKYNLKGEFYNKLPKNRKFDLIVLLDVIGHLMEPIKIISELCDSLKKQGILRISFDNLEYSWAGGIHRNKEINFHKLLVEKGLTKINSNYYKKV